MGAATNRERPFLARIQESKAVKCGNLFQPKFAMVSQVKSTRAVHHLTHVKLTKAIVTMIVNVVATQSAATIIVNCLSHRMLIAVKVIPPSSQNIYQALKEKKLLFLNISIELKEYSSFNFSLLFQNAMKIVNVSLILIKMYVTPSTMYVLVSCID